MHAYFNLSVRQKLLSTNYGTEERMLGALAPDDWRLQGSLGRRQIDGCVIWWHDSWGSLGGLREAELEGKGAQDWVLSPALKVKGKVVEKLEFLAGICEPCRVCLGEGYSGPKKDAKVVLQTDFLPRRDALVLFWMWRVYIKRDLHFAEQHFRIYNSGKSPWKH